MNSTSAVARVLTRIAAHRDTSKRLGLLDDVSGHLGPFKKTIITIPGSKGAHFKQTAERFANLIEQFLFVALVCRRKIDAITDLLLYSISAQNAVALAQGSRSLVEHVAVQVAIDHTLQQTLDQLKGQTEGEKIHQILQKAEVFFHRCYAGRSPKIEKDKAKQALHVNDCLALLDAQVNGASDAYDFLCEFVHPNHGSNTLVSTADLTLQVESVATDMTRPEVQRMLEFVLTTLDVCESCDLSLHSKIALLGIYTARFKEKAAKVSNIFSVRKLTPTGDGKTKETAIFFSGARDILEHREQWQRYVSNRRITIHSRRSAAGEGNSVYDLYESSVGQLWHRIDYPEWDSPMDIDGV